MFSVERDIAFGLENLAVPPDEMRTRVDEAMRQLGITDLAQRAPHELSDGQKQRVALAGVIVMRPRLIILDEPTSLLDPKTAVELVELVRRLRDETGITFLHQTGKTGLRDVNLKVEKAEMLAVDGENGAGKTTLVKHVNGLLKPTKGTVLVDGEETTKKSTAELSRKVGIAFQNPDHQLFSESVEAETAFALKNFGFSRELIDQRLNWALQFFGLEEYRNSSPLALSGGEKKRLTLACILAWDPEVVILDEPTVGQDAIQKEKLSGIIKMLRSTGKTTIIVSHDIEFIWPLQPRLVVMSQGRVVADGPADTLMRDEALLEGARVMQPQLVELYQRLRRRPDSPFASVNDARLWITGPVVR